MPANIDFPDAIKAKPPDADPRIKGPSTGPEDLVFRVRKKVYDAFDGLRSGMPSPVSIQQKIMRRLV